MIIDCHGHYTTFPKELAQFREAQIAAVKAGTAPPAPASLVITDAQIREGIEGAQLKQQRERGTDLTIFSPRAAGMGHHVSDVGVAESWARVSNDLIHRVCNLYPGKFIGVCQLPQVSGVGLDGCVAELERCVTRLGFVGCNLNPDPSGGYWADPPLTARHWYPLYEKLVELDVPAMVHTSMSCTECMPTLGAHYLNADTAAFNQLLNGNLFQDFPTLRIIIPHGGGAVPYHWGRFRGLAMNLQKPPLAEHLLRNVFFDTCVYHQPGIELLTKVIPIDNILFASEMVGAVKGVDPETGFNFDDTRRYVDQVASLSAADRHKIFEGNARRVFPRLDAWLTQRATH